MRAIWIEIPGRLDEVNAHKYVNEYGTFLTKADVVPGPHVRIARRGSNLAGPRRALIAEAKVPEVDGTTSSRLEVENSGSACQGNGSGRPVPSDGLSTI